jgi:hypothetical protein
MFIVTKLAEKVNLKDSAVSPVRIAEHLDTATHRHWRGWELETIQQYLATKNTQALDKIYATQVVLTNEDAFTDPFLFGHVAVAFNNRRCNFNWLDVPSYLECAYACHLMRLMNNKHVFGPAVLKFLSIICHDAGVLFFPWIGGEGLDTTRLLWIKDEHAETITQLKKMWIDGIFENLTSSDVDDTNILHVQMAKIVNAQDYIRRMTDASRSI